MKFNTKLLITILLVSVASLVSVYLLLKQPQYVPNGLAPDVSNIGTNINNINICSGINTTIAALLIVVSHAGNLEVRDSIRRAYPAEEIDKLGMKRIFLLATLVRGHESDRHYNSIRQEEIDQENEKNHDIVQYNIIESYSKLTYKTLLGLKWGVENCYHAELLIKMDDDVLIDLYQMSEYIDSFTVERRNKLIGSSASDSGINFILGLLYMTSPKTAEILLKTSRQVAFHSHEDIYVTGLLPRSADIGFHYIDSIYTPKRCLGCCTQIGTNIKYLCGYIIGQRKDHGNGGDYSLIGRIQEHSAYCYYSKKCETFPLFRYLIGKYLMSDFMTCIPEQCISVL